MCLTLSSVSSPLPQSLTLLLVDLRPSAVVGAREASSAARSRRSPHPATALRLEATRSRPAQTRSLSPSRRRLRSPPRQVGRPRSITSTRPRSLGRCRSPSRSASHPSRRNRAAASPRRPASFPLRIGTRPRLERSALSHALSPLRRVACSERVRPRQAEEPASSLEPQRDARLSSGPATPTPPRRRSYFCSRTCPRRQLSSLSSPTPRSARSSSNREGAL